jgi:hypothetical protein
MAIGIANNTVKWQHSRLKEMRYFWVCDKGAQVVYNIKRQTGQENLADHQNKHHMGACHLALAPGIYMRKIHPWYYRGRPGLAL